MTSEEQEKIDKLIEEKEKLKALQTVNNDTKIEMPNFIPEIDKTKDLSEQASEVVQIMGAQKASTDEDFMSRVSKNFQDGVLSEQETKNMQKKRLLEQEYYLKWQDALNFIFIKSPHGLVFMKIMTIIAMLIYIPTRLIGMLFKAIGLFCEFVNEIFNSIFGGKGRYLKDKDGNPVIDPNTKKPYIEKQGYNLFAKALFGTILIGIIITLMFLFIKAFTGFSVFAWFRSL